MEIYLSRIIQKYYLIILMWQGHPLIPWKEISIQMRNPTLLHEYDQIITGYFKK